MAEQTPAGAHHGRERQEHGRGYLPAMGKDWLLPLYDPFTRLLGVRSAHRRLADRADLQAGHRVLEVGCGTGNLALLVKRGHPRVDVVGLDPDPLALARCRRKAARKGLAVQWDRGFAGELPYPDESFDRVLSAFMLHHLDPAEKLPALREFRRVLRDGGALHLLDVGGRDEPSDGRVARRMHHNPRMHANPGDAIPPLMREAGLTDPVGSGYKATLLGRYTFYRASR